MLVVVTPTCPVTQFEAAPPGVALLGVALVDVVLLGVAVFGVAEFVVPLLGAALADPPGAAVVVGPLTDAEAVEPDVAPAEVCEPGEGWHPESAATAASAPTPAAHDFAIAVVFTTSSPRGRPADIHTIFGEGDGVG